MIPATFERQPPRPFLSHPVSLAIGALIGGALAFALARGSVPANQEPTQGLAPTAERQDSRAAEPSDAVCAAQTWPYIERGCVGRTGPGPRQQFVRVVAPDRMRSADAAAPMPTTDAAAIAPVKNVTPQSPQPATETAGSNAAVGDFEVAIAEEPPPVESRRANRRVAAVPRTRTSRTPERRSVTVLARPGRAGIVAEGQNYRVRRVYLVPRDDGMN
jgi:hypothetical protein